MTLEGQREFDPFSAATREQMAEEAYVAFRDAEITLEHPDLEERFFIAWAHLPEDEKVPFRAIGNRFCDIAGELFASLDG